jgi:hypothetical protein
LLPRNADDDKTGKGEEVGGEKAGKARLLNPPPPGIFIGAELPSTKTIQVFYNKHSITVVVKMMQR